MSLHAIVETLSRPGLLSIAGRSAEKRLQHALEAYFRILGRKILALGLQKLAADHPKSMVRHAVHVRMHNTLRITTPLLRAALETGIQHGMMTASKIHHFAETAPEDLPTDATSIVAADYASQSAGQLVTGINSTTLKIIQTAIETGIDEQLGVFGTASLLQDTVSNMTQYRSQVIATTEMNDAMSESMLRKLGSIGVEWKQWITGTQCCDICADNEDSSPIPIDAVFPSGDDRPPAHPNCRCAIAGSRPPQD
jgi:hypothetical protein